MEHIFSFIGVDGSLRLDLAIVSSSPTKSKKVRPVTDVLSHSFIPDDQYLGVLVSSSSDDREIDLDLLIIGTCKNRKK